MNDIKRPLDFQCTIGQHFGANATSFYSSEGLRGHPGIDESCGYGSDIKAYADGIAYSLYTPQKPASDGYTAIFTICETPLEVFELAYGHVSDITVAIGATVRKGQVIGKEGNKGVVYSGGQLITLAMQRAGDTRGSHRHGQKRPLKRVKDYGRYDIPLRTAKGIYRDAEGFAYIHADPNNGYAGCTNFAGDLWTRNLAPFMSGYDVYLLQKALVLQGYADHEPTDYYGTITMGAVMAFQREAGLAPVGLFGPQTRAMLNAVYKTI